MSKRFNDKELLNDEEIAEQTSHIHSSERRDISIELIGWKDGTIYFTHSDIDRITEDDLDALTIAIEKLREDVFERNKLRVVK